MAPCNNSCAASPSAPEHSTTPSPKAAIHPAPLFPQSRLQSRRDFPQVRPTPFCHAALLIHAMTPALSEQTHAPSYPVEQSECYDALALTTSTPGHSLYRLAVVGPLLGRCWQATGTQWRQFSLSPAHHCCCLDAVKVAHLSQAWHNSLRIAHTSKNVEGPGTSRDLATERSTCGHDESMMRQRQALSCTDAAPELVSQRWYLFRTVPLRHTSCPIEFHLVAVGGEAPPGHQSSWALKVQSMPGRGCSAALTQPCQLVLVSYKTGCGCCDQNGPKLGPTVEEAVGMRP